MEQDQDETKVQVICWRDIPAQVKVRSGGKRLGRPLSQRFQVAIDEAAMRDGKSGSDEYMAEWRMSAWQRRDGDPDALVDALCLGTGVRTFTEDAQVWPRIAFDTATGQSSVGGHGVLD